MRLSAEVISVLDASTCEGNALRLPCGRLDRSLYIAVNKAIEALGGKWNKRAGAHIFAEFPADAISDAISSGSVEDRKQVYQFFETPQAIADRIAVQAEIRNEHSVLEPSAGRGRIVDAIRRQASARVTAVELDPKHCDFLRERKTCSVHECDFLSFDEHTFDRIVANPPFSGQQDVKHILHMYDLLNAGGILVSIGSASITFRNDRKTKELRELISRCGSIEELPPLSFRESGTNVSTCIVTLRKAGAQ